MKRLIGITLVCVISLGLIPGCSPVVIEGQETSGTSEKAPASPKDDYYRYINEDRLKEAVFEYGELTAGSAFDQKMIGDQIESVILDTVSGAGYEKGSEEYLIQTAYNAFREYDFENEPIPEDLTTVLDEINNVKTVDELLKIDVKLIKDYGLNGMLGISVGTNYFASGENIMTFVQQTGVLNCDFETVRDDSFAFNSLVNDVKVIMQTMGYDVDSAEGYGRKLAVVAMELYGSTNMDIVDSFWPYEYMSIHSADEINKIFTNIELMEYLEEVGFDLKYCDEFCVVDFDQVVCLNSLFVDENIDALKTWEICKVYYSFMRFIAPHYILLKGNVKDSYDTPEEQAINEISQMFIDQTDPIYVERFYTKDMDDALRSMCDDIRGGYRELIKNADWLSEATRNGLLEKLENIIYITGTDLKRHDNSKYAGIGGNYYQIMIQYNKISRQDFIDSLSKPVDRKEISMSMQMFNACYDATTNSITITSAITNAPFFDVNADYYTNLGGLGSVIAHEMGHAFDSDCIVFDKNGVYDPEWIADEDMKVIKERDEKAVSYFEDNFTVFGIYHVDGEQTLGENYADLGGMECVTSLAKNNEDLKKIFENYATIWSEKAVDEAIIDQIAYDSHSPNLIRTNAILSSLDSFYEAYGVKEGDGMYIAPGDRVSRWY